MPLRDYECKDCQEIWEELRKDQSDPEKCKKCNSINIMRKLSKNTGFVLKGSGWYKPSPK